jgi:hypothetical protein
LKIDSGGPLDGFRCDEAFFRKTVCQSGWASHSVLGTWRRAYRGEIELRPLARPELVELRRVGVHRLVETTVRLWKG